MKALPLILTALAVTGISYGAVAVSREAKLLGSTCFNFGGITKVKLSRGESNIGMKLIVKNKSHLDLAIKSERYTIYINEKKAAYVFNKPKKGAYEVLTPNKAIYIPLDINFDLNNVLRLSISNLLNLIADHSKINIRVVGSVSVASSFVFINRIPIDFTMTLKDMTATDPNAEPC